MNLVLKTHFPFTTPIEAHTTLAALKFINLCPKKAIIPTLC